MCAHTSTYTQSHSSLFQFLFQPKHRIDFGTWNEPFTQVSAGKYTHMSHKECTNKANLTQGRGKVAN